MKHVYVAEAAEIPWITPIENFIKEYGQDIMHLLVPVNDGDIMLSIRKIQDNGKPFDASPIAIAPLPAGVFPKIGLPCGRRGCSYVAYGGNQAAKVGSHRNKAHGIKGKYRDKKKR